MALRALAAASLALASSASALPLPIAQTKREQADGLVSVRFYGESWLRCGKIGSNAAQSL